MSRPLQRVIVVLLIALTGMTGCHPTQPFYLHDDGDLSHYLRTATRIEFPDVETSRLADVAHARAPITLSNPDFDDFWDIALEESVSIALQNSKVIRNLGSVTQFGFADALVGRTASAATVYDAAIVESDPQSGIEAALSNFDVQYNASATIQNTDRPQNVNTNAFGVPFVLRQNQMQFDMGLRKRTAVGTQFEIRSQSGYDRNNRTFRPLPSDWLQTLEVEVNQPLLQGRGAQINRMPVVLARINADVSLATFESSVRNLILDIENSYWDLHLAYRNLETAKVAQASGLATWRIALAKKLGGAQAKRFEAQARAQFYEFRAQLQVARTTLQDTENRLRFLMGIAATDMRILRPKDEPTSASVKFDWAAVHTEALVRSPELRQQKWVIKRRELEQILARNQLLPQLNAVALYRWLGLGDDLARSNRRGIDFPQPGSTAWGNLTGGDFQEFRVGLELVGAIGSRRQLSGVRNAQLQLARDRSRLEDMELNVSNNLTVSVRNLDTRYHLIQSYYNQWVAANEEVKTLSVLQAGGGGPQNITTDDVLEAQRRLFLAQSNYYQALCDYNKAIAGVHFTKGSLLEHNNVHLAEGAWPKKAYWDALGKARERDSSYYLNYGWSRPSVISQGEGPQANTVIVEGDSTAAGPESIEAPQPKKLDSGPAVLPKPAANGGAAKKPKKQAPTPKKKGPEARKAEKGPDLNRPIKRVGYQRPVNSFRSEVKPASFDWESLGGFGGLKSDSRKARPKVKVTPKKPVEVGTGTSNPLR